MLKRILPAIFLLFLFSCKKEEPKTIKRFVYTDSITDVEGNYYHVVTIGSQVWMAENLRTTHYQNGDTILYQPSQSGWSTFYQRAYCNYANDSVAAAIYGKLYTFGAVNDARNICPPGWHLPSQAEWQTLLNYLGAHAGDKLREAGVKHWLPPNDNATNEVGFAALPGGWRSDAGDYYAVRHEAYFWTATQDVSSVYPQSRSLHFTGDADPDTQPETTNFSSVSWQSGCAVRCIKN